MILTRKRRLRLHMSQQTAVVPRSERLRQAGEVFNRLEKLEAFRKADNIALFWSLSDEIPTQEFLEKWASRKNIFLPVIHGRDMVFCRYDPQCKMVQGILRTLVPDGTPVIDPSRIDLIVAPGMAFDPYGGRLGRGKGYYDRYFEVCGAPRIGICMEHQLIGSVPAEPHDKRVDIVISPSGTFVAPAVSASAEPSVTETPAVEKPAAEARP